jgi:1,4-alpha-glucan branching enzyme
MNTTTSVPAIHEGNLQAILRAEHGDPFSVLGMHSVDEQLVVRVFRPDAAAVTVENLLDGSRQLGVHRRRPDEPPPERTRDLPG